MRALDAADPARVAGRQPPFSQLQRGLPGIPRALLTQRLGSLQRAGLIERRPTQAGRGWEYHLSPAGRSFGPVVEALGRWGYQWAAEQLRPENLDAGLLMWFLRRRVRVGRLPADRVTVQFEFREADKRCFWLVLHRPDVDLCLADPGFDTDLCVTTDVRAFTRVFLGQVSIAHALGDGSVTVPVDVATVHVTFQPGGSTGWDVHPGPALVTVKTGQLTLLRAKGCRTRTSAPGRRFWSSAPRTSTSLATRPAA
jgi:DNA-binding HxlR family transcriptional regulator